MLAYLDDVVVVTPPELAGEVLPAAQRALGAAGLALELAKTQAWSPCSACPPGLERQWRADGLTLVGVPIGEALPENGLPDRSDEQRVDLGADGYEEERCREVAQRAAKLLARLAELPTLASPHLPAVQVAALLLRLCGCGKITHLLRSNPPARTEAAAKAFDKSLLQAYVDLAGLDPLSTDQEAQCQLPLRLGGRGLRSQAAVAAAAWVASWAQCLSEVVARAGLDELGDLELSPLPLAQTLREALASLPRSAIADEEELPSWKELAQEPCKKLQRVLSKRLVCKNAQPCSALWMPKAAPAFALAAARLPLAGSWPRPPSLLNAWRTANTDLQRERSWAKTLRRLAARAGANARPATGLARPATRRSAGRPITLTAAPWAAA